MTTQVALCFCSNAGQINEKLLQFQAKYPKRNIINVSLASEDTGWTIMIVYQID